MKILHLIDQNTPQATPTTLELMAASQNDSGRTKTRTILLGGTRFREQAERAGIRNHECIHIPFGHVVSSAPGLYRKFQALRRVGGKPFDLIHCWSIGTFSLAFFLCKRVPILLTLTVPPTPREVRWLRILTRENRHPVSLLPISSTIRRDLLSGGVSESAATVLRPGIDLGKVAFAERESLRKKWGVTSERDIVVASFADPPLSKDTLAATAAVYLADGSSETDGLRLRLLVHPDQKNRLRAQKIVRYLDRPDMLIQDDMADHPWSVLPGCDLILVQGPLTGGLSLLWAMSAKIPIVGEATYAVSEYLEDRHSALLAKPGQPKSLAKLIARLLQDPRMCWKLHDTARHEAYSFFSCQHYRRSLRTVYEQAASGKTIEVPSLPQTGGLRFAGRV